MHLCRSDERKKKKKKLGIPSYIIFMEKTYHKNKGVVCGVWCEGAGNHYKRTECIIGVLYIIYELRHLLSIYINI